MQLIGLANTEEIRECRIFRSPSACLKILRHGLAATAAADNGALNVWIDNDGKYRAESQRHFSVMDSRIYDTQKPLVLWLKKWLKKIK